MKKILFLLVLLFIITGCKAEYNLTIDDNFNEVITYYADESDNIDNFNVPFIPLYYDKLPPSEAQEKVEGIDYYQYRNIKDDYSITESSYKFKDVTDFARGLIATTCLGNIDVNSDTTTGITEISTLNRFHCFNQYENLTNVTINIKLSDKYELIDTNAPIKNNNELSWNFTKTDPYNCSIYLKYKTKEIKKDEQTQSQKTNNNKKVNRRNLIYIFIGFISFLVIIISLFVLKIKGKL